MSFGAYYGANTTIEQAAAGLGAISVSRMRSGRAPGLRLAGMGEYFSGVLGQPPIESHDEGVLGQPPIDAYKDGVFAGAIGSVEAYRSGSLGAECASGLGTVEAYRSGSLGAVGPAPTHNVLLSDPETIKEVKTVIGMHPLLISLVAGQGPGQKIWTQDFFVDPIWDERAGKLWALAIEAFAARLKKTPATVQAMYTARDVSAFERGDVTYPYPNAAGLKYTLATGMGMPTLKSQFTPETFPVLYPWYKNAAQGAKTAVEPPLFEKQGIDLKRAAMWGVGGLAVVGLAMAVFGKKSHA